ncbi:adhesion G protein-coupled receptor F5-like [Sardina pilchardus]|uniref:adhesion G protein-coupled receptor F5-like n=1 Tax=Sardina pilchardus TaxID=27697 RepID=UPI002E0EF972
MDVDDISREDTNECEDIPNICGSNSHCTNTNGSFNCSCLSGYRETSVNQTISGSNQCTDVDECLETPPVCGPNSICNNTIGDFNCSCLSGYNVTDPSVRSSAESPCSDVDECIQTPSVCGPNSDCNNTIGDYKCSCLSGYNVTDPNVRMSADNFCTDINECVLIENLCGPNSNCVNTNGSYNCSCLTGYQVTNPNQHISDSNQCTVTTPAPTTTSITQAPTTTSITPAPTTTAAPTTAAPAPAPTTAAPTAAPTTAAPTAAPTTAAPTAAPTTAAPTAAPTTAAPTPAPTTAAPAPAPIAANTAAPESASMTLTLRGNFETSLNDPTSGDFRTLAGIIENAISISYGNENVPGFTKATVTGFRQGSIIADINIAHTSNLDWAKINQRNNALADELQKEGYEVTEFVSESVPGDLIKGVQVHSGDESMTLNCPQSNEATGGPEWRFGRKKLNPGLKYAMSSSTLTVKKVVLGDEGRYECRYTRASKPTLIYWSKVTIKPDPVITRNFIERLVDCGASVNLKCCVPDSYQVILTLEEAVLNASQRRCSESEYTTKLEECGKPLIFKCKLLVLQNREQAITLNVREEGQVVIVSCKADEDKGEGAEGDETISRCGEGKVGEILYRCEESVWVLKQDNCVLEEIQNLKEESENLNGGDVSEFLLELSNTTQDNDDDIVTSPATIASIVAILDNVAAASREIRLDQRVMENFLDTVNVIVSPSANNVWSNLNSDSDDETRRGASSNMLGAVDTMSGRLSEEDTYQISTESLSLSKSVVTTANNGLTTNTSEITFTVTERSSTNTSVTIIEFFTLSNIMSNRNSEDNTINSTDSINSINANILLVDISQTVENITLTFKKNDSDLANPLCVFWNFKLFNNSGGWDTFGCELKVDENSTVRCECNHTTSFSVLMSPYIPPEAKMALDIITYVGVGISIASLVITLIIEGIVWRVMTVNDTAYMRHVCIVNIAVSLLIADIWFIVGAAVSNENGAALGPCTAATFFAHFFYLAMFFWMLMSALLLLYRIVWVFSNVSRLAMMLIGFFVGYGGPLITAVVTVASTAGNNGYITSRGVCWLNWEKTKALLAFVIPALVIVAINLCVMMVVLVKMLRRGVGDTAQSDEKHNLKVIAKCVAVLTPLFGITWGFGIGIMISPESFGLHVVFALLNSLQGFFILVFGILLDKKVRDTLAKRPHSTTSGQTSSTSGGVSSSTGLNIFRRAARRPGYRSAAGSDNT